MAKRIVEPSAKAEEPARGGFVVEVPPGDAQVEPSGPGEGLIVENILPDALAMARVGTDLVKVRVKVERGLLGNRAVWLNELHVVPFWQYERAHQANPAGYELVGDAE